MQSVVGHQLRALAELLQKVYACVDLGQIARALVLHVRDAVPPEARDLTELAALQRRLVIALEDLFLAAVHREDEAAPPELAERISKAETFYNTQIEAAARAIDRHGLVTVDGAVLRAASQAIAEAAQEIVRRRSNEFALDIARDQETLGAPPSVLFRLDGTIVWSNHALTEWIEHRKLDKTKMLQAACRFAMPLCERLRSREQPSRTELKRKVPDMVIHLSAEVKRRDRNVGETLLLVEITEAVRATELSPRELEVARLVSKHGSYRVAAEMANISIDSIRTYVRRIYRKFGVSNRAQLKARLIRQGMLKKK